MENTKSELATDKLYMQLNASELSAIISKGSPHSNDRDAGFCSGSSEGGDDLSIDHSRLDPSSPTDASEDSVEVKVLPISLIRNKRKSSEPSKVICKREENTAPLKKRIRYTSTADSGVVVTPPAVVSPPPQPQPQLWDPSQVLPHELMPNPAEVFIRHPGVTTLHRAPVVEEQEEPLALVLRKPAAESAPSHTPSPTKTCSSTAGSPIKKVKRETPAENEFCSGASAILPPATSVRSKPSAAVADIDGPSSSRTTSSSGSTSSNGNNGRPQQRNYKNMTRERRIEANARERTRVHTISAAYETLRRAVPSYSHAQKLSKLSVLRVACAYILTLSRMAGEDYSEDQSAPSIASCFDSVTATIQTEGKIRKKKDE